VPPDPVVEVVKPEVVARGRYLVQGMAACGFCHGEGANPDAPMVGGRKLSDLYGEVVASNITQHPDGLGGWSASEIQQLFRAGTRPDGSMVSSYVHRGYKWMSDQDLQSVISFLRTLPSNGEVQPRRSVSFIDRNTKGFWESSREVRGYVPQIKQAFSVEYGKYLVDNVAKCSDCHNQIGGVLSEPQYLAGGQQILIDGEAKVAPGINSSPETGIGAWSEDDIVAYLRSGSTPSGRAVDSRFCPVEYYSRADNSDLLAIAKFLKTVQ